MSKDGGDVGISSLVLEDVNKAAPSVNPLKRSASSTANVSQVKASAKRLKDALRVINEGGDAEDEDDVEEAATAPMEDEEIGIDQFPEQVSRWRQ